MRPGIRACRRRSTPSRPRAAFKNTNTAGKPALVLELPDTARAKPTDRLWRVQVANLRVTGNDKSGHGILVVQVNEVFLTGALRCTDSFNLCLTGNCLDDHLGHGVIIENTYGSVLSGNMIEECKGTAIILDRDCYGITLSANVIAHNGAGIDLRDAHGCAVSGNTFTINAADALKIGPNSGRITVTGNNFSNSYLGAGKVKRGTSDPAAAGLKLDGTTDIAIAGNLFAGVRPKAVETTSQPSRRVLFADNVLTDAISDHDKLQDAIVGPVLRSGDPSGKERPE
jgi:parallel beta-helix repeat protein